MSRRRALLAALVLGAAACGPSAPPPPAAADHKLEDAVRDARYGAACRRLVAQEWPVSLPVPADAANPRRFKIFFYPLSGSTDKAPRLAEPTAEAVVDADTGADVDCRLLPGVPKDVAEPRWTPAAQALDADAFDAQVAALDGLTEKVAAVYAARRPPAPAETELIRRYLDAFALLAEPPFLENYRGLNPAFWDWARAATGRDLPKTSRRASI